MDSSRLKVTLEVPPPYNNGDLHLGHLYEYCLIYPFYRIMDYETVKNLFSVKSFEIIKNHPTVKNDITLALGVDSNGLPIMRHVISKHPHMINNNQDLKLMCDDVSYYNNQNIRRKFTQMGLTDLRAVVEYNTNEPFFKTKAIEYIDLLKKRNMINRTDLPQRFCTNCNSIVSKSETEQVEVEGRYYYVKCSINGNEYQIMTTQPEYVINAAFVAYNPEDERYKGLKGLTCSINVLGRTVQIPVYESNLIHPDVGTGLVYVAKWGNQLDVRICRDLDVKINNDTLYLENGTCSTVLERFGIKDYKDVLAIPDFYKHITIGPSVLTKEVIHSERSDCKNKVIFVPSNQVVVNVDRDEFVEYIDSKDELPTNVRKELISQAKGLREWCVSRGDVYYSTSVTDFGTSFNLDTWLLSSLTYMIGMRDKIETKHVWRLQGSDIVRTWALYSMFTNLIFKDRSDVHLSKLYFHKMVCDQSGQKFSKSRRNSTSVQDLLCKYDKKWLRLYFCSKPLDLNFKFAQKQLYDLVKCVRKLTNLTHKWGLERNLLRRDVSVSDEDLERIESEHWTHVCTSCINPHRSKSLRGLVENFLHRTHLFYSTEVKEFQFSRYVGAVKSFIYEVSYLTNKEIVPEDYDLKTGYDEALNKYIFSTVLLNVLNYVLEFVELFK